MKIQFQSRVRRSQVIISLVLVTAIIACRPTIGTDASEGTTTVEEEATTSTTVPPTTTTTIATPEPIPVEPPEGFELAWNDEFDGDAINRDNWTFDIGGWGWGNGEAQHYTDRPENARIQNGLLVIEARQERYEDSYYTSARLKTQGLQEFQYGRFEARLKVPEGAGLWPAFWMLGAGFERDEDEPIRSNWPFAGEIDIMEYIGREPNLVLGTIHGPGYSGSGGFSFWNPQEYAIADEWHIYGIDWDFDGIRWFYDGELYGEAEREIVGDREWVFDQPFFILLNLAVGGMFSGPIGLDVEFPKQYYVDYVRIYQPVEG